MLSTEEQLHNLKQQFLEYQQKYIISEKEKQEALERAGYFSDAYNYLHMQYYQLENECAKKQAEIDALRRRSPLKGSLPHLKRFLKKCAKKLLRRG